MNVNRYFLEKRCHVIFLKDNFAKPNFKEKFLTNLSNLFEHEESIKLITYILLSIFKTNIEYFKRSIFRR